MTRREFVRTGAGAAVAGIAAGLGPAGRLTLAGQRAGEISASRLPRWRGFNLLEKFTAARNAPYREEDFAVMAEWGFDFARLPMSYQCWTDPRNLLKIDGRALTQIDRAVEYGRKNGVHVCLNLHRAPGYCVNPPAETLDLWTDETALAACTFHWRMFARRYQGVPSERLSFDLINEPRNMPEELYTCVVRRLVDAIRAEDPGRLIIADGLRWGNDPVDSLVGLGVAQSTRGYQPMRVSHYRANWVDGGEKWPEPTWPLHAGGREDWDRERLLRQQIEPWRRIQEKGVGVHVGEWGVYRYTPHAVALAWMRDCLELWNLAGWGWALWNLRGTFGVLDSGRADVKYDDFRGHKLDRAMLELLRGA